MIRNRGVYLKRYRRDELSSPKYNAFEATWGMNGIYMSAARIVRIFIN